LIQSFFSSQLIHVNEAGQISIVSGAWWFGAVSIPLTVVTFLVWRYWLSYSLRKQDRKDSAEIVPEKPGSEHHEWRYGIRWHTKSVSRFVFALRRGGRGQIADSGHVA
jgi:hypothetical protein